jgi:hypothetical protein
MTLAEGDRGAVPGIARSSGQLQFSGGDATREEASSAAMAGSGRKAFEAKGGRVP